MYAGQIAKNEYVPLSGILLRAPNNVLKALQSFQEIPK